MSDIEHAAIGNRVGRRQRSQGSWRKLATGRVRPAGGHGAVRVIKVKVRGKQRASAGCERVSTDGADRAQGIAVLAANGACWEAAT